MHDHRISALLESARAAKREAAISGPNDRRILLKRALEDLHFAAQLEAEAAIREETR